MKQSENEILKHLRKKIFITAQKNGITHVASGYSCLEILYALYGKGALRIRKEEPEWEERDRFILSKGHAALALYAVLEEAGILKEGETATFLKPNTRLAGEPCKRDLPVIEASTGSLGHGLSLGVGMALTQKLDHKNARTVVLLGDGECQEGSVWEAAMSAAAYGLDNLIAVLDCNELQKMSRTCETMKCVDWYEKWSAFGWYVTEVNGHDTEELYRELAAVNRTGKPKLILAHTVKGKGVSIMENDPGWHYKIPRKKEIKQIMYELDISEEELSE